MSPLNCLFAFWVKESVLIHANAINFLFLSGKKRPAWDYKGRLEDMEELMLKSKSYMEDMTKTIGDNQGRIGFLESLNKQLEGTVQVKHQQTEEVALLLCVLLFSFVVFSFFHSFSFQSANGHTGLEAYHSDFTSRRSKK